MTQEDHHVHGDHEHKHSIACGHTKIRHNGHIDYVHNGHLHCEHEDTGMNVKLRSQTQTRISVNQ
ncbi:MAG: hypothetical protein LRY71_09935 [Bacillaceae bacterium]|nr:hypothetical protein [Bacillaceae bacterium]